MTDPFVPRHRPDREPEPGIDIALRDIVRVEFADGGSAVGRVIAMGQFPGRPATVTVETPRGDWSGPAREARVLRTDERNRLWRDGE